MILYYDTIEATTEALFHNVDSNKNMLVVSASFRDSKRIYERVLEYIEYYKNLEVSSRHHVDRFTINNITIIPIGDGNRARGLRPDHLVIYGSRMIPAEALEKLVSSVKEWAAESKDPVKEVTNYKQEKM